MLVSDFNFDLPEELIAQQPPAQRGASRMLVLDRASGALRDAKFADFPSLLNPGDLLVLNDSRVIPARLYARRTLRREREKPTGRIEVMLTEPAVPQIPHAPDLTQPTVPQTLRAPSLRFASDARVGNQDPQPATENLWHALVRPGRKIAIGERLVFPAPSGEIALEAEVIERGQYGDRLLQFAPVEDFFGTLERIGHVPLPPYIHRDDAQEDRERYQTVYSNERGSVAAPTAGLHFTPQTLEALTSRGVEIARITLHVGLGTFAPLRVENLDEVKLHQERYTLGAAAADAINRAVNERRRIVAVGTTVVRTLEAVAAAAFNLPGSPLKPHSGVTDIFISPGFEFCLVRALLTNFHLPQSSLLMLVSAFAGREHVLAAYRHAVQQRYRFFSYGDCMFID